MPVILWQIWRFVSPGLYKHERRYALPFVVSRAHAVRDGRRHRVLDAAEGARLAQADRRRQHHAGLHRRQVLPADRLHDAGVRHRLRVPDRAVFLQMVGDRQHRAAAQVPPPRDRRDLRRRRGGRRRATTRSACSRCRCRWSSSTRSSIVVGPDPRAAEAPAARAPADDCRRRVLAAATTSRSIRSSAARSRPSTPASRCSWPRRPGRARPSSPSTRCASALPQGGKAFYTAPIKALSNQKYGDLARRHGADRVGLLTGDNASTATRPSW